MLWGCFRKCHVLHKWMTSVLHTLTPLVSFEWAFSAFSRASGNRIGLCAGAPMNSSNQALELSFELKCRTKAGAITPKMLLKAEGFSMCRNFYQLCQALTSFPRIKRTRLIGLMVGSMGCIGILVLLGVWSQFESAT